MTQVIHISSMRFLVACALIAAVFAVGIASAGQAGPWLPDTAMASPAMNCQDASVQCDQMQGATRHCLGAAAGQCLPLLAAMVSLKAPGQPVEVDWRRARMALSANNIRSIDTPPPRR